MRYLLILLLIFTLGCDSPQLETVSRPECVAVGSGDLILPDPNCNPGLFDPRVTQDNLDQTICKSGYTDSIRPSSSYTNRIKSLQLKKYGFTGPTTLYKEDHIYALEIGGDPRDPKNLWPQPSSSAAKKDVTEDYLHGEICSRRMTLAEAQHLAANWVDVYNRIK